MHKLQTSTTYVIVVVSAVKKENLNCMPLNNLCNDLYALTCFLIIILKYIDTRSRQIIS